MKLPFQPLSEAIGRVYYEQPIASCPEWRFDRRNETRWVPVKGHPTGILSELLGVSARTLTRWQRDGINELQADRVACSLGMHVSQIWPEWFSAETHRSMSQEPGTLPA